MKYEEIKGKPWEQAEDRDWASVAMLPVLPNDPNETKLPLALTIRDVKRAVDVNIGGKRVNKNVAFFSPNEYIKVPMMLNSTNQKTLSRIAGSRLPEKWIGKTIVLHFEKTRNPQGGEPVEGLRIVPAIIPPAEMHGRIMLKRDAPNFLSIKEWLKSGKGKLEGVTSKYYVEPSALMELEKCCQNG